MSSKMLRTDTRPTIWLNFKWQGQISATSCTVITCPSDFTTEGTGCSTTGRAHTLHTRIGRHIVSLGFEKLSFNTCLNPKGRDAIGAETRINAWKIARSTSLSSMKAPTQRIKLHLTLLTIAGSFSRAL